jgi:hypothetical protein
MDQQTDDPNRGNFSATGSAEGDRFYGCWLDINQPFKPDGLTPNILLPLHVPATNVDGPFTDPNIPLMDIHQAMIRSLHQCLIAEIAFDSVAIPIGKDPSNWNKLAQRNLAWSDIGSAQALTTFEIRPTPIGLPVSQTPDELMIDWGNTPSGSSAQIYLPAVNVADVLALAARMYGSHRLVRVDDHSRGCRTGGITYIPIPRAAVDINYAGLLSVDPSTSVRKGDVFHVVVRQVTNAFGRLAPPPQPPYITVPHVAASIGPVQIEWRRVIWCLPIDNPGEEQGGAVGDRGAATLRAALDRAGNSQPQPLVSRVSPLLGANRGSCQGIWRRPDADSALAHWRRYAEAPSA